MRKSLERLAIGDESTCIRLKADIAIEQRKPCHYESRIGYPFAQEGFMREWADLRDALKLGLSVRMLEGGTPVAELFERIRLLRDSVTVETASERVARKAVRAERPVTARIRVRRAE